MFKLASLAALVIFAEAGAQIICTEGQIQTKGQCLEDCKTERFKKCANKNSPQVDSVFCALNIYGQWEQFTKECQPCNRGFVGVREGKCKETLKKQKQHQPPQSRRAVKTFSCPNIKTNDNCPETTNEDDQVCGFDIYHQFKNFKSWCHACKQSKTKRYVTESCEDLKKSVEDKKPEEKVEKLDNCSRACKSWQICKERTCVDKCEVMRCSGECKQGKCLNKRYR